VRKVAIRDGWRKSGTPARVSVPVHVGAVTSQVSGDGMDKVPEKVSGNHAKVSERLVKVQAKVWQTFRETIPARSAEAADPDLDDFGTLGQLSDKQETFVREYMVDWNATQAAIRAGYSAQTASTKGGQLLKAPGVRQAIEALATARAKRLGIDADELMRMWAAIVALDANEITQLRRVCCPYCWGENHQRQYTPSGLERARERHDRERARRLKAGAGDDIGEFPEYSAVWYDKRKEPHPDCPECSGQGIAEVYLADTRKLSPAARLAYAGVKEGREGIEVMILSKEKAADNLARALGLFRDKEAEVNINLVSGQDLHRLYDEKMRQARDRQTAVLSERGLEAGAAGR
jgi:hypothetical protein